MSAVLVDPEAVRDRLAAEGLVPADAPYGMPSLVGDGQSNLTYCLEVDGRRFVVRRPPPPPFHRGAHDVVREARVLAALAGTAVPVPAVLAVIADHRDGAPAVVTEFLDGDVITDAIPDRLAGVSVASLCRRMAEALAEVHSVSVDRLAGILKHPTVPYLVRQLDRYARLTGTLDGPNSSLAAEVGARLRVDVPAPVGDVLVHGDLRLGNMLWSPSPGQVPELGAVLDWELAALGDPDADLAYFLMAHPDPFCPGNPISDMASALIEVWDRPARADLARWYVDATGRSPRREPWFAAFVRWRAAVGLEFLRLRRERGHIRSNSWLECLDEGVPTMLTQAAAHLREDMT